MLHKRTKKMIIIKIFLKDLFIRCQIQKIYNKSRWRNNIIFKKKDREKTNELDRTLVSDEHVLIKYY